VRLAVIRDGERTEAEARLAQRPLTLP